MIEETFVCAPQASQQGRGESGDDRAGHHEFGRIDGADDLPQLGSSANQARGYHRSPATTADRIEETANAAERSDKTARHDVALLSFAQAAPEDEEAHDQQIAEDIGSDQLARHLGEKQRAGNAAELTGNREKPEQPAVDIAMEKMRHAGGGCGE